MTEKLIQIKHALLNSPFARILLHLFFWVFVAIFYFILFSWNNELREITIIFSAGLLPVTIAATYFFNYILIPNYLWKKSYTRFFLFSFYTLLIAVWFSFLIVFYALIFFLIKKATVVPSALHPELQVITQSFVIFLAISIKQVRRSFFIQEGKNQLEKTKLITDLKLKEAELKLLKAQIHPHFLFNTLNNLYGLALEKSDKAPELVLQLSEILDYMLYRCNEKQVLLSEEIGNLKNYIEIEKIRYSDKLKLELKFPVQTKNLKIAPLIILPFIENVFKHGVSKFPGIALVNIKLQIKDTSLILDVINTKNPNLEKNKSYTKGIGLNNVQKRLDLMYPGKHSLNIANNTETYSVNLILQLED